MKSGRQVSVVAAAWFVLFIGILASQWALDRVKASVRPIQSVRFLPNSEYLRVAALGYQSILADLLWLRAIQVMGERKLSNEDGQWLYQLLDVVTTIDPSFVRAYEAGSHALCTLVVMPAEANRLLEKGMRHNPQSWSLPFLLGINQFFEFGEDDKAAKSIALAGSLPGAPERLVSLAARLFVSAKSPQQAVEILAKAYEEATNGNVRQLLETRLKEAIVERDLQIMEAMIERYYVAHAQRPRQLDDLVRTGLLRELPTEPFGGQYVYESTTGIVRSTEVKERMNFTMRRRQKT